MLKFPSKRLFLSLFLCTTIIILLQNYNMANSSFTFNIFSIFTGLFISFLFFIPPMLIKKKTQLDFMSFAHRVTPSAIIFVSAYYSLYFVYTIEYFLLSYTDMFVKKLNPDANKFVITLILLVVCLYSACKGINAITRSAIFIFAISLISYILIFSGLIPSLDFSHRSFEISGNATDFISNTMYFLTPSFTAVIFACVSCYTKNFKIRHSLLTLMFTAITFVVFTLFVYFGLGSYADNQEYQSFLLSKASQLGTVGGFDGLYLSVSTLSVFLIVSIIMCCIRKTLGEYSNNKNTITFGAIIFVLYICSGFFNSVEEILTDKLIFNILSFISAVVIPTIYICCFRRRLYE